jgi:hypothetical protein
MGRALVGDLVGSWIQQMKDQKREASFPQFSTAAHLLLAVVYFSILGCAADFYPKAEGGKVVGAPIGPKDTILFDREGIQFMLFAKEVAKSITGHEAQVHFLITFSGSKPAFKFKDRDFTVYIASEKKHVLPNEVTGGKITSFLPEYPPILDWQSLDGIKYCCYYLIFSLRFPGLSNFAFQVPPMEINGKEVILPPVTFTRGKE